MKVLGVWFAVDAHATASLNYKDRMEKAKTVLYSQKFRRLSLLGKIMVLKSLVVSQLVYVLAPLKTDHKAIKVHMTRNFLLPYSKEFSK